MEKACSMLQKAVDSSPTKAEGKHAILRTFPHEEEKGTFHLLVPSWGIL